MRATTGNCQYLSVTEREYGEGMLKSAIGKRGRVKENCTDRAQTWPIRAISRERGRRIASQRIKQIGPLELCWNILSLSSMNQVE
jgi:hypothetical protein